MNPDADAHRNAIERLRAAADRAHRSVVGFPPEFVSTYEGRPTLAKLIQGGRGGEVRLKLYLCITMRATKHPYDLRTPPNPRGWCRMLALPQDTGPRRVRDGIQWLEENRLIALTPRVAAPAMIKLLHPSGNGTEYQRPVGHYVSLPIQLWTNGWLLELSATALALLLVIKDNNQGEDQAGRYVTRQRRESYGLSPDTWTRARKELVRHKILTVMRIPLGDDVDYHRMRNRYVLNMEAFESLPQARWTSSVEAAPAPEPRARRR